METKQSLQGNSLIKIDSIISRINVLHRHQYIDLSKKHITEAAMVLESMLPEKHVPLTEQLDAPTQENLLTFIEDLDQRIKNLSKELTKFPVDVDINDAVMFGSAGVSLVKAGYMFRAFYNEIKAEYDAFNEYNETLKKAKNVIIFINEEIKAPLLKHYMTSLWKEIWEKEVYVHNEYQAIVSDYMKAENLHYESLHCEDCIKKFSPEDTLIYTMGFKAEDKLPVAIDEKFFVVPM